MKLKTVFAAVAAGALLFTGCSSATPQSGSSGGASSQATSPKLNVIVAFYPLQYASEAVAGDRATVTNLTTPGAEPHDLELTPKQIASLGSSDLVVYLKGFQKQVDDAVAQQTPKNVIDVSTVVEMRHLNEADHDHDHAATASPDAHDHGGVDPHVWLDPSNMSKIAAAVGAKLAEIDATGKDAFASNVKKATEDLATLDGAFKTSLASCKVKEIITTHEAFGYLTARYNLTQIGISGLSPDAEPSPARIAEVHALAKKHGVTTIFYETLTSPAVAKSIAGDLGLKTDVLDPIEGITKDSRGRNYLEVMQANLTALKTANGCS